MYEQHQSNTQGGIEQGCAGKVDEGAQRDFPIHFGIQTGRAGNQAGDDQGEYHELEQTHKEFTGIGDKHDGVAMQLQRAQREACRKGRD